MVEELAVATAFIKFTAAIITLIASLRKLGS